MESALVSAVKNQGYSKLYSWQRYPVIGMVPSMLSAAYSAHSLMTSFFKKNSMSSQNLENRGVSSSPAAQDLWIIFKNSVLNIITFGIYNSIITYSIDWICEDKKEEPPVVKVPWKTDLDQYEKYYSKRGVGTPKVDEPQGTERGLGYGVTLKVTTDGDGNIVRKEAPPGWDETSNIKKAKPPLEEN